MNVEGASSVLAQVILFQPLEHGTLARPRTRE
jgi:hypothetical protein